MDAIMAAPIGALLIFLLRAVDVSMAMFRLIVAVRGYRSIAASIGFVEILLWLIAAGHALQHLDSIPHMVGYAGGFSAGTYLGIWLEHRFGFGISLIRVICPGKSDNLTNSHLLRALRETGYAVTEIDGRGQNGPVHILDIVVDRHDVPVVTDLIQQHAPRTFVTVEEIQTRYGGFIQPGGRKWPFRGGTARIALAPSETTTSRHE